MSEKKPPTRNVPSFSASRMPSDITPENDTDAVDHETSRRVAVAPAFNDVYAPHHHDASRVSSGTRNVGMKEQEAYSKQDVAKETTVTRAGWPLKDAPVLPPFYPLERSAVFVTGTSCSEIANRISNVLRERSIDATFDNYKAKATCMTRDHVDFRIRLYRGRDQYSHGIVVEVQRREGTSFNFHSDTVAILNAAEGKLSRVVVSPPPVSIMVSENDEEHDWENSSVSWLEVVSRMIHHSGHDSKTLALETLSSLTDETKMGKRTATGVARKMLEPENDVGVKVVALVVDDPQCDQEMSRLRVMAMESLSNAIRAVDGTISGLLRERLRPVLLRELRGAEFHPQMAHLAALCLEPLITGEFNANEFFGPLETARAVGQARHAALARQTAQCINLIISR